MVYTNYGSPDVLQLQEVAKPTPKDDEVLIKVYAAATNASDWHLLRGKPFLVRIMGFGLIKPKHKILGSDLAGQVEAVGRNVKQFQPGFTPYCTPSQYVQTSAVARQSGLFKSQK
jgi:NADPH:quinone reductase-like Zn-dependent oxidoreductase